MSWVFQPLPLAGAPSSGSVSSPIVTPQTDRPVRSPSHPRPLVLGAALVLLAGASASALPPGAQLTSAPATAARYAAVHQTLPTDDAIPAIRPTDTRPPTRLVAAGRTWTGEAIRDVAAAVLPPGGAQTTRPTPLAPAMRHAAAGRVLDAVQAPVVAPALSAPTQPARAFRLAYDPGGLVLLRVAPPGAQEANAPRRAPRGLVGVAHANALLMPGVDLPIGDASTHRPLVRAQARTTADASLLTTTLVPVVEALPPGAATVARQASVPVSLATRSAHDRSLVDVDAPAATVPQAPRPRPAVRLVGETFRASLLLDVVVVEALPVGATTTTQLTRTVQASQTSPVRASWLLDIAPVGATAQGRSALVHLQARTAANDGLRDVVLEALPVGGTETEAPQPVTAQAPSALVRASLLLDAVVVGPLPPGQASTRAATATPTRAISAAPSLLLTTLAPVVESLPPGGAAATTGPRRAAAVRTWTGGPPELAIPPGASSVARPVRIAPIARISVGAALSDDLPVPMGAGAIACGPQRIAVPRTTVAVAPLAPPIAPPGAGGTDDGARVPYHARPALIGPALPLLLEGPTIDILEIAGELLRVGTARGHTLRAATPAGEALRRPDVVGDALRAADVEGETLRRPDVKGETLRPR